MDLNNIEALNQVESSQKHTQNDILFPAFSKHIICWRLAIRFFFITQAFSPPPPHIHLLVTFLSPNSLLMQMISMALHKDMQKKQPDVFLAFQEGREVSE